jgi:hypothetical protein
MSPLRNSFDAGLCHRCAIVVDGGLSLTNWFEPPELGEL